MDILDSAFKWFPTTMGGYVVGGSIRDILLGRSPTDYDVAVKTNPMAFAQTLAMAIGGRVVEFGSSKEKIWHVVSKDATVDVSGISGLDIENDLKRRDFTINAMAFDLYSRQLIDVTGGRRDLSRRTVRMISESAFVSDPIRLLRAYRIGAQLQFEINPKTASAIGRHAGSIQNSAGERVRSEFLKLLGVPSASKQLSGMSETQLLVEIFPELGPLKDSTQSRHHDATIYEHTLRAFKHLETILNSLNTVISDDEIKKKIKTVFDNNRSALLKAAILFHDIGKPQTRTEDESGESHFFGHDRTGAEMATAICRRLRMSNNETRQIQTIIHNHSRPMMLFNADQGKTLTPKGAIRFFKSCGELTLDVLIHAMADAKSKRHRLCRTEELRLSFFNHLLERYVNHYCSRVSSAPLITGYDLIERFKLDPSPQFGEILNQVEENRLAGILDDRQGALEWVAGYLKISQQ